MLELEKINQNLLEDVENLMNNAIQKMCLIKSSRK